MRPEPKRVLDLFCGGGGAAMGLHRAWPNAEITGIDIKPQPHYPFIFIQADAMNLYQSYLRLFDFLWASPPCQGYSRAMRHLAKETPRFIASIRARFDLSGKASCIENVPGAPLRSPMMLCGGMFNLGTWRHRLFECSFPIQAPIHNKHDRRASRAGHWEPGTVISVAGNCAPIAEARKAMGIDWMTRDELAEAIPPAYSEYIGRQYLAS